MQCLDEFANISLAPTRQQSNQLIGSTTFNDQVQAARGGQDVKLSGNNYDRHEDWREMLFELNPCVPDEEADKTCVEDPIAELAKMELFLLYNTDQFNKNDASTQPVTRDSVILHFEFNPEKKYEIKSVITQGKIDENRGIYSTSSADFFDMKVGQLTESVNPE